MFLKTRSAKLITNNYRVSDGRALLTRSNQSRGKYNISCPEGRVVRAGNSND